MSTQPDYSTEQFSSQQEYASFVCDEHLARLRDAIVTAVKSTQDPLADKHDQLINRHLSMIRDAAQLLSIAQRTIEWIEIDRECNQS